MPIAYPLRFKILDLGRRLIFVRDWVVAATGRMTGRNDSNGSAIPRIGFDIRFASGTRTVTGWSVPEDGPLTAAVLLFHGIGDRSESWRGVQQRLAQAGVRSLIFHYRGYGGNSAETTVANMEMDARSAYR